MVVLPRAAQRSTRLDIIQDANNAEHRHRLSSLVKPAATIFGVRGISATSYPATIAGANEKEESNDVENSTWFLEVGCAHVVCGSPRETIPG